MHVSNPYADQGRWLRGNLHTHTTFSDGTRPPEAVFADYEARGYDFLAISDHDVLVDPAHYRAKTSLTLIPAVEVSRRGPHILHIDARARVEPKEDRQSVIDAIDAQGAFAIVNHPNWGNRFAHCPHDRMEAWTGYVGLEIYNGVIEFLPGAALATDRWDRLLSEGRCLWGFANDDAHRPEHVEIAWNVVRCAENTPDAIVAALRSGSFYASTGVEITDVRITDGALRVETSNASRIRFLVKHGAIRQTTDASVAEFRLPETDEEAASIGYVRAECYGDGGRVAWTQPIFVAP